MAQEEVGGPLFVGSGPASEQIPEHDSTVDENQTVGSAVVAGPITINAVITVTGTMVVM